MDRGKEEQRIKGTEGQKDRSTKEEKGQNEQGKINVEIDGKNTPKVSSNI